MTPEQQKAIDRCGTMLKRAFPSLAGKLIFRLTRNEQKVKVDYVQYGISEASDNGVETVVTVVD